MVRRSATNQFPGINPHLNSFLQQSGGGWEAFHADHINEIARTLDKHLPDNYYAVAEKSLQLIAYQDDRPPSRSLTIPDVSVYQTQLGKPSETTAFAPLLTLAVEDTFDLEETPIAAVIYRMTGGKVPGTPITRLELLSPANKPPHTHYLHYLQKRQETLRGGLKLVEIDYLHTTRPLLKKMPSYFNGEDNTFPYWIIVNDPTPDTKVGQTHIFGFGVDDGLPTIRVPLVDSDSVLLDLGQVYQQTFAALKLWQQLVDYDALPVEFERYSARDQARILGQLEVIRKVMPINEYNDQTLI
jgi:hypothetical protein